MRTSLSRGAVVVALASPLALTAVSGAEQIYGVTIRTS